MTILVHTQPDISTILNPTTSGTAPIIATGIALGVIAVLSIARAARNYLNGKRLAQPSE